MYDFLIVGAGLAGCTFAYLAKSMGYKCLVLEKRQEIGGMCATEEIDGIVVHKHGAHIFKTSDKDVWELVTGISKFEPFINAPKARYKNMLFSLPINMNTFHELWGVITPEDALKKINEQKVHFEKIETLEQFVLSEVGEDVYKYLIKDYTEKQWGKKCSELPPEIMRRIPIRLTYDNNYYNAIYQGIPVGGYSAMMGKMLEGVELRLGVDYVKEQKDYEGCAKTIVYTGAIDDLFSCRYGALEYRSLIFDHRKLLSIDNYQGVAVVNHTSSDVKYTRVIEHKHFQKNNKSCGTIITFETPCEYHDGLEKYYSVNDSENQAKYEKYNAIVPNNMLLVGRLAEYRYIDMAETIRSSIDFFHKSHK